MKVYNIEFYAYLPKISIFFFLPFDFRSGSSHLRQKVGKIYGEIFEDNEGIFPVSHKNRFKCRKALEASLQETRIVWWRAQVNDVLLDLELWIVDDFHVVGGEQTVGPVRTQTLIKIVLKWAGSYVRKYFKRTNVNKYELTYVRLDDWTNVQWVFCPVHS